MFIRILFALCICFASIGDCKAVTVEVSDALSKITAAGRDSKNAKGASSAIRPLHDRYLREHLRQVSSLSDNALHDLFQALEVAFFYASTGDYGRRDTYLDGMAVSFDELSKRRVVRSREAEAYFKGLLSRRKFSKLSELRSMFQDGLQPRMPSFNIQTVPVKARAAYELTPSNKLEIASDLVPDDGTYLVIVIGCHFAEDAARAISQDLELTNLLAGGRVIWLLRESETDPLAVKEWNEKFPAFRAHIAYDHAGWEGVNFTSTPTFSFFRNGRLITSAVGWGSSGVEDLRGGLKSIALID